MDLSAITAALGGVKHALGIVEVASDAKKALDIAGVKVELLTTLAKVCSDLADANMAQVALAEELRQAKETIARDKKWAREAKRYRLAALGPAAHAYALKPEAAGEEPPHHLCQPCYEQQHKVILQFSGYADGCLRLSCARCHAALLVREEITGGVIASRRRPSISDGY